MQLAVAAMEVRQNKIVVIAVMLTPWLAENKIRLSCFSII
jgi:hypothetical protein